MKLNSLNVPNRILMLLKGWTIEDLVIAKVTDLTKIKGIGLVTAKGLIEAAKDKLNEKKIEEVSTQKAEWGAERKRLRERIASQAIIAVQEIEQEPEAISIRVRRIREANA